MISIYNHSLGIKSTNLKNAKEMKYNNIQVNYINILMKINMMIKVLFKKSLHLNVHVKMDGIQKILDHYADKKIMNGNVVNLEKYKQLMALE